MTIELDKNRPLGYSIMAGFLISVTANYILAKLMDLEEVTTKDGVETHFKHPVF